MEKKKLEIVELDLGVDPSELQKQPIDQKTQERINNLVEHVQKEHDNITKFKERKAEEEQAKEDGVARIYKALTETADNASGMTLEQLMEISNNKDVISLMVRLRNYITKRGNLWILKKGKKDGKTTYRLIPNLSKA